MIKIVDKIFADDSQIRQMFCDMVISKLAEEEVLRLYLKKLINGFCHLYLGQEAVAAGICCAMDKNDSVITSYRCHGFMFMMTKNIKSVICELLGKKDGCSKGKGGSMHMFSKEKNFFGGHGIVGAQTSLGTGIGFANKYKGNNGVSITILGDGAINQGQFYESLNIAKVWNLPVLYIVENNLYAMGTSIERSSSSPDSLYKRGVGFGVEGFKIDGMNAIDVHSAVSQCLSYIRENPTPIILELVTYRYKGHSMSDPAKYRTREEVEKIKSQHDPIEQIKKYMIKKKIMNEEEIMKYIKDKAKELSSIAEECVNSEDPDILELKRDIYAE